MALALPRHPSDPLPISTVLPLHHRLYTALRQRLLEGRPAPGQRLPGELQLAQSYGVSRVTVRRALAQLAAEGLVERSRARGTFALAGRHVPAPRANISGLFSDLVTLGQATRAKLLAYGTVPTPADIAARLGHPAEVLRIVRLRTADQDAVALYTHYLPPRTAAAAPRRRLAAIPVLSLLEGAGHHVARSEQVLTALSADAAVANHLGVALGMALLCLKRLYRDAAGEPLEYNETLYRPDRFEYRLDLTRDSSVAAPGWAQTDR